MAQAARQPRAQRANQAPDGPSPIIPLSSPVPRVQFNTPLTRLSSCRTIERRLPGSDCGRGLRRLIDDIAGDRRHFRSTSSEGSPQAMETIPLDDRSLRNALEGAGLRCTPQRLAVYDILIQSSHHPTAEDVFQAVRSTIPGSVLPPCTSRSKPWWPSAWRPNLLRESAPPARVTTRGVTCTTTSGASALERFTTYPLNLTPNWSPSSTRGWPPI